MQIILRESQFINLFEAATLNDIYTKYYSKIPEDIFRQIISADPTYRVEKSDKMGKYGKWLLSLYMNRELKLEDLYKATTYLKFFIKYYNVINDKDINKCKSLSDLYNIVAYYMRNDDVATSKSDEVRRIKEGAEKVYEDSRWLVIVPHTQEASCYYGKNTQWCTAASEGHNYFNHYNDQGPLYINIDKVNNEKYQFHFETDSFMDETDSEIEAPIAETCELSDGLCNWYREHVEDANKLFEVWIDFFYMEDNGYEYVMIQDENDETIYRLYDKGNSQNVCGGLVCNGGIEEMRKWSQLLYKRHYCIIPNVKGLYTLLVIDEEEIYAMIDNAVKVERIKNDYSDMENDFIFFDVIYNDGRRCILQNNGVHQYVCEDASMIQYIESIGYDTIEIRKTNGYSDLLNWNYEEVFHDLKDIEYDEEDYDFIYATKKDGQRVRIDMINSSEELVDDNNNDEYNE